MELDCGIRRERIVAWLDEELSLARDGEGWTFREGGTSCRIALRPLGTRVIATFELEHTLVSVDGDEEAVEEFNRLFTLRFMSAGG